MINMTNAGMISNLRLNMPETSLISATEIMTKPRTGQSAAHLPSLDLLRGVSALAVAIPHFFLLSGVPFERLP